MKSTFKTITSLALAAAIIGGAGYSVANDSDYFASDNAIVASAATSISKCSVTLSKTSYTYDGKAKKPGVTVKNGKTTLKKGTDYSVSYSNNTNAGEGNVIIQGKGKYSGKTSVVFKINKRDVSDANITLSKSVYEYNGKACKPTATVKVGSNVLKSGTDYNVSYAKNINAGYGECKITGKGNYKGSKSIKFVINMKVTEPSSKYCYDLVHKLESGKDIKSACSEFAKKFKVQGTSSATVKVTTGFSYKDYKKFKDGKANSYNYSVITRIGAPNCQTITITIGRNCSDDTLSISGGSYPW